MMRLRFLMIVLVLNGIEVKAQTPVPPEVKENQASMLLIQGMTRAFQQDYKEAIALYEQSLQLKPESPAIMMALAEAYLGQNVLSSAVFYAQQAARLSPSTLEYAQFLAFLQDKSGNTRAAIEALSTFLANKNKDIAALKDLALYQEKVGDLQNAIQTVQQLAELRAENPVWATKLISLYEKRGDGAALTTFLSQTLAQDPSNRHAYQRLIAFFESKTDKTALIPILERLSQADPTHIEAALQLSALKNNRFTNNRATATVQISSSTAGNTLEQAKAYFNRAETNLEVQTEALRLINQALIEQPQSAEIQVMKGKLLYWMGDYTNAAMTLTPAIRKYPRDLKGWALAVRANAMAGHPKQGLALAEEAAFLFPSQPSLLLAQSFVHFKLNEAPKAQALLREVQAILNTDFANDKALKALYLETEGDGLGLQGKVTEARAKWQEALTLDPNSHTLRVKLEQQKP